MLVSAGLQAVSMAKPGLFQTWMGLPFTLVVLLNTLGYGAFLRRAPDLNRRQLGVYNALLAIDLASVAMWLVAWLDGLPLQTALRCYLLALAIAWGVPSFIDERRALVVSFGFLLAIVASYVAPGGTLLWGGLFGGIGVLLVSRSLARARRA
jgi:hypothetical protein